MEVVEKNINNDNIKEDYNYEDRLNVPYIEKKNGDEFIKQNSFEQALKHYSKAIMAVKILNDDKLLNKDELDKYVREVGVPSNLNLSLCYLKLKDWHNVVVHTNRVIEYDRKHIKARYRRCLAYIYLHKFEKADEDLVELEYSIGGTPELEELEKMLEDMKNEIKDKEGLLYKKMLRKYVDAQEKLDTEDIKNRWGVVANKTPMAIKKIIKLITDSAIIRPFNFIKKITSTVKHYMLDMPYSHIRNICRKKKKE